MVLYEYSSLFETLGELRQASKDGVLEAMFDPMIKVATKYKDLALNCKPILIVTMLHPAWQLLLISNKFSSHHSAAQELLVKTFQERQILMKPLTPSPTKESSQPVDPKDTGYIFFPINAGLENSDDKLNRYHCQLANKTLLPLR
jgi:hypothetical protein